jgi:hypothetical protein
MYLEDLLQWTILVLESEVFGAAPERERGPLEREGESTKCNRTSSFIDPTMKRVGDNRAETTTCCHPRSTLGKCKMRPAAHRSERGCAIVVASRGGGAKAMTLVSSDRNVWG